MTDNIKQEANTANKLPKGNSIFQRMVKTNMARTAAILALMSAVPLMESKADSSYDGVREVMSQASNVVSSITSKAVDVENLEHGASLDNFAVDAVSDLFGSIGRFMVGIPQLAVDFTRFSGQQLQYLGKQIDEHPVATICLGGFAAGLLVATRYREFLSFTELGKLRNNSKIIDKCTKELDSLWAKGDKLFTNIFKDIDTFCGSNLNIETNNSNPKENLEYIDKQIINCNKTMEEISRLKEQVNMVHEMYEQTMNNLDRNVINVVAIRKVPDNEGFYKGLLDDAEKTSIDGDNKSIFDQLSDTLNKFAELEKNTLTALSSAELPGKKDLSDIQNKVKSNYEKLGNSYGGLISKVSLLSTKLQRLSRHNNELKKMPEPSNGGLGVWNKLASLIRR